MFQFWLRWWCVLLVPSFIFKLRTGMNFFAMLYVSAILALWTAPLVWCALKDFGFLLKYFTVLLVGIHCLVGLVLGQPFMTSLLISATVTSLTVWIAQPTLTTD
jgi:hypothetical protein